MLFIPGWLTALLTFPGIVVHELAHAVFCFFSGTRVYEISLFQPGQRVAGFVRHEMPRSLWAAFLISIGPLIVNSVMAILIGSPAMAVYNQTRSLSLLPIPVLAMLWLGFSIGIHALPSNQDFISFASTVNERRGKGLLYLFSLILLNLMRFVNLLRFFWIDAIYAVAILLIGVEFYRLLGA